MAYWQQSELGMSHQSDIIVAIFPEWISNPDKLDICRERKERMEYNCYRLLHIFQLHLIASNWIHSPIRLRLSTFASDGVVSVLLFSSKDDTDFRKVEFMGTIKMLMWSQMAWSSSLLSPSSKLL